LNSPLSQGEFPPWCPPNRVDPEGAVRSRSPLESVQKAGCNPDSTASALFLLVKNGKTAGQIKLEQNEIALSSEVLGPNRLVVLTGEALYLFGIGGCPPK
jgi:hypothetical protein